MNLSVKAAGKTDTGLLRKNNEDNFGYDLRHGIFVLCDGMGGQAAGEVASRIAVDTVIDYFCQRSRNPKSPVIGKTFEGMSARAAALANAIQMANLAIQDEVAADVQRVGMGSTIVAASIEDNFFSIAHVGDSRIYLVRGSDIQQLTSDHSLVMEQVRRGLITPEEAGKFGMQNVIVRALGSEESVEPDLADHEFLPGDVLLLCSDGLSRFAREDAMLDIVSRSRDLETTCSDLIEAAKTGGSDDNITCLLVKAVEQRWHHRLWGRAHAERSASNRS